MKEYFVCVSALWLTTAVTASLIMTFHNAYPFCAENIINVLIHIPLPLCALIFSATYESRRKVINRIIVGLTCICLLPALFTTAYDIYDYLKFRDFTPRYFTLSYCTLSTSKTSEAKDYLKLSDFKKEDCEAIKRIFPGKIPESASQVSFHYTFSRTEYVGSMMARWKLPENEFYAEKSRIAALAENVKAEAGRTVFDYYFSMCELSGIEVTFIESENIIEYRFSASSYC